MKTFVVLDFRLPSAGDWAWTDVETPFGTVRSHNDLSGVTILAAAETSDPRASAYAARLVGAERVLAVMTGPALRQPTLPNDFIEFTSQRPTTFFETVGTGYVQQQPPFCPEMAASLLATGVTEGGILLILDQLPTAAVRQWWQNQGIDNFTTWSQPEGALCRELEMCWTTLLVPPEFDVLSWLRGVDMPASRHCTCGQTMQFARQSGKLSPDWRQWITRR